MTCLTFFSWKHLPRHKEINVKPLTCDISLTIFYRTYNFSLYFLHLAWEHWSYHENEDLAHSVTALLSLTQPRRVVVMVRKINPNWLLWLDESWMSGEYEYLIVGKLISQVKSKTNRSLRDQSVRPSRAFSWGGPRHAVLGAGPGQGWALGHGDGWSCWWVSSDD